MIHREVWNMSKMFSHRQLFCSQILIGQICTMVVGWIIQEIRKFTSKCSIILITARYTMIIIVKIWTFMVIGSRLCRCRVMVVLWCLQRVVWATCRDNSHCYSKIKCDIHQAWICLRDVWLNILLQIRWSVPARGKRIRNGTRILIRK